LAEDWRNAGFGLYVHWPFCQAKCPYCDFYSITDLSLQPAFFDALASEMNMTRELDKVFDTLYIGGGTPSVLNIKIIDNIIKTAHQCFNILSEAEITIEVNPGTVTIEQLKGYRQAGVNRINIGVQSFNSANLDFIERIHSVREAQMAIRWAQKAGYEKTGCPLTPVPPESSRYGSAGTPSSVVYSLPMPIAAALLERAGWCS